MISSGLLRTKIYRHTSRKIPVILLTGIVRSAPFYKMHMITLDDYQIYVHFFWSASAGKKSSALAGSRNVTKEHLQFI